MSVADDPIILIRVYTNRVSIYQLDNAHLNYDNLFHSPTKNYNGGPTIYVCMIDSFRRLNIIILH